MFLLWLEDPVTEVIRAALRRKRQELKDEWENGNVLALSQDEQMLRNAAAIGQAQAFRFLQEMTFEQLQGEMSDD
jgi:hypothetical protein